jgi:hypothetical protein
MESIFPPDGDWMITLGEVKPAEPPCCPLAPAVASMSLPSEARLGCGATWCQGDV